MTSMILHLFIAFQAAAHIVETPNIDTCLSQAEINSNHYQAKDVLYVFDIDNTALELVQNLGSVQWYRWQRKLIEQNDPRNRVANTLEDLLTKQGWIYQLSRARPPEDGIPKELSRLQQADHAVIFHTSRNTDVRGPTERELKANSMLPLQKTLGPQGGYPSEFTFAVGPEKQRGVSFQNGVYMSAGQDKGTWLALLLKKVGFAPKAIVFVDDERKNLESIERAFETKLDLTLCRYGKTDQTVEDFNRSTKDTEIELWNKLSEVAEKLNR